jgi:type VI secretion system (T6SS) effector TldE1-like protein
MAISLVPASKWSVAATLAVITFSVGWLAVADAPGLLPESHPLGTLKPDLAKDVEARTQPVVLDSGLGSVFEERFAGLVEPKEEPEPAPSISFTERFAAAFERYEEEGQGGAGPSASATAEEPQLAGEPPQQRSLPRDSKKPARVVAVQSDTDLMQERSARTAIYDISAHAVYLPNGERLEAHSGLGSGLDDPRYVGVKGQGPTPPNVYRLLLRDRLFHGVRAIRLVPVDEEKMFGRAGILAHPYMLGPKGESNGCVSVRDYPVFLNAFLRGEVDRLVVINHFEGEPTANAGLEWLSSFIRKFFTPS